MLEQPRRQFNANFTEDKYRHYLEFLKSDFPDALDFRVAETPVFVPAAFLKKMLSISDYIISQVKSADFMQKTEAAIPAEFYVPGPEGHPHFLIFDFGICGDKAGTYTPQLIEMQGFPTLFAYQLQQYRAAADAYQLGEYEVFSPFIGEYDEKKVKALLSGLLRGHHNQKNEPGTDAHAHTILLELFPEKQKTRIDFLYTDKYFGVPAVCLTELKKIGNKLYYTREGEDIRIDRIYNRLIFDELTNQSAEVKKQAEMLMQPLEVTWVTHPNWFYRLSKYTLPLLSFPGIPETRLLADFESFPVDLEHYVLKPLFSFAGNGVVIDVTAADLEAIPKDLYDKYILQKKVTYAPAIQTPDGPARAELRLFYLWPDELERPVPICNLARLTKGNMVSVAQNKNKTWVGGSFALFEQEV